MYLTHFVFEGSVLHLTENKPSMSAPHVTRTVEKNEFMNAFWYHARCIKGNLPAHGVAHNANLLKPKIIDDAHEERRIVFIRINKCFRFFTSAKTRKINSHNGKMFC